MQYKKEAVRTRILEEGSREYLKEGYRGGNISRIAAGAGVPVGNLYRYFDGKAGLLEAIVKPAYTDIPRILKNMSQAAFAADNQEQLFEMITKNVMTVYKTYGTALLILVDKCVSTPYEDFTDKLVKLISGVMVDYLFISPAPPDADFAAVMTKAFLNAIFDVFKLKKDDDETAGILRRLLIFYFYDVKTRI